MHSKGLSSYLLKKTRLMSQIHNSWSSSQCSQPNHYQSERHRVCILAVKSSNNQESKNRMCHNVEQLFKQYNKTLTTSYLSIKSGISQEKIISTIVLALTILAQMPASRWTFFIYTHPLLHVCKMAAMWATLTPRVQSLDHLMTHATQAVFWWMASITQPASSLQRFAAFSAVCTYASRLLI